MLEVKEKGEVEEDDMPCIASRCRNATVPINNRYHQQSKYIPFEIVIIGVPVV